MCPKKRGLPEPRYIKPESVDIGDYVRVTYPESGGITVIKEGRVASREDHGSNRIMLTAEGSQLFVWEPVTGSKLRITLLDRPVKNSETLFDLTETDSH